MKSSLVGLALAGLLVSSAASADPMPARDTARVLPEGKWRTGFVAPLEVGVGHGVSLSTSLVPWLLLSPNGAVRVELARLGPATVSGDVGLSVPTEGMRLLQGYLFPAFAQGGGEIGWSLVPAAGLAISAGRRGVLTGRMDVAVGIPLGHSDATPLETYAPIDLLFAPTLTGYRFHTGVTYDLALLRWLRARVGVSGYWVGASPYPPRSPFYLSAEAALEVALGSHVRLALGAVYYNHDQRQTALQKDADGRLQRVSVRSNDVHPTLDLIFGSR